LKISFDLADFTRRTISTGDLESWGGYLQFEKILQYIDLPKLKVESVQGHDDLFSPDSETISNIRKLKGRLDVLKILNWLRLKGGVQEILEVNVIDDDKEPHSDEAIEMALKGLDVEILNWRKLDLCSDVMCNAAPNVRVVYLYSSGNKEVLRGWSSASGLARLSKVIHCEVLAFGRTLTCLLSAGNGLSERSGSKISAT